MVEVSAVVEVLVVVSAVVQVMVEVMVLARCRAFR